jgi:glycosyltransferase involved in cell wall biosynthesis
VQSEQMKSDLVSYGLQASKLVPVPMGVDLTDFEGIPMEPPPRDEPPTIAYLGTLAAERRIDFLVRCLAHVVKDQPDARLLLVGDADRSSDLELPKSEARRLGVLDRIEITGFLQRKEAWRRVARGTVCVSPFYPTPILNSTSPTKLVEYMALGRPVVANDHPEQRLVIEASSGGLCVPWDEHAFANAIVRMIRDPVEAEQMGKRGRAYVEAHRDYRRIASCVESEYQRTLTRKAQGKLASPMT